MHFGFFSMYRNPKTRPRYFYDVKTTPVIVKLDVVSGVDSGQRSVVIKMLYCQCS